MIALRYYRMYDIGKEIDLDGLERSLAESYVTARARFNRVKQKSIMIEDPPLFIRMDPIRVEREGQHYEFNVAARIYGIGAISICFIHEDPAADYSALAEIAFHFAGQEGLSEFYERHLLTVGEILRLHLPHISITPEFFEDYTVYVTDRKDDTIDPVMLLVGDRAPLSPQMREETTRHSLSYTPDDIAVLSWDAALLCNPDYPTDLIDLIEYANVQVLELRYYDRELNRQMEKMYDDIEQADRLPRFRRIQRMRKYHAIMAQLMETTAEISEITEKVDNLIKVTEDVYYARVYAMVLKVLRSRQWSESVNRKIEVIRENYGMLSDEVRIQHSNFLEWVVIILIALEVGLAIGERIL